jgi:D-sedoheptulose 7-phosphate isomerase
LSGYTLGAASTLQIYRVDADGWGMQYPEQYRSELLNTLKTIDLSAVEEILEIFREARANGRCIFVCGTGSNAIASSRILTEMVRSSNVNRAAKFRIFTLTDDGPAADDPLYDRALIDELRNVASPGDVIVGICASRNCRSLMEAFEYAHSIGCRTISISGSTAKLASISDASLHVPTSNRESVEDAHMIVCRMIGHYFVSFDHD